MKHVVVIGASSQLGRTLLLLLGKQQDTILWATYHSSNLDDLINSQADWAATLNIRKVDVRVGGEVEMLFHEILERAEGEPVRVVYCCGKFGQGRMASLDRQMLSEMFDVGVVAPSFIMSELGRSSHNFLFCAVSGLPGRENAFAGGAPYASVTSGLEAMLVSAARERHPTGGFALVQIGLVDNGQSIIDDLERVGAHRPASNWSYAARFVLQLITSDPAEVNGTILRLPNGCPSYDELYSRLDSNAKEAVID